MAHQVLRMVAVALVAPSILEVDLWWFSIFNDGASRHSDFRRFFRSDAPRRKTLCRDAASDDGWNVDRDRPQLLALSFCVRWMADFVFINTNGDAQRVRFF